MLEKDSIKMRLLNDNDLNKTIAYKDDDSTLNEVSLVL